MTHEPELLGGTPDLELPDGSSAPPRSFNGMRILKLCWQKRLVVRNIFAVVMLLTIAYLVFRKPVYSSTTSLMPPDSASNTSNLMSLLASAPSGVASASSLLPGIKTPSAVFVGILQSTAAQEGLVERFNLQAYYKEKYIEDACRRLSGRTSVSENPKNGIVTITVEDSDPVLASNLAKGYVAELDRIVAQNSTSSARRERIFLEGRIQEIKTDLDTSSNALSQFATKNKTLDMQSQAKAMVDTGLKLEAELVAARSDLAGLRQTYSEDNMRVRAATARISELERQIAKINGGPADSENTTIDGTGSYPSVSALPTLGVKYADLQRRVTVDEALWGAMIKQYESAKVQEARDIPTVRVLDTAEVPQRQSSTRKSIVLLLGIGVSTILSLFWGIVSSAWENLSEQDEKKQLLREIFGSRVTKGRTAANA